MREIVVISGKGGTGKTSVTAALAHLAGGAVICDLDVDAPDLHILLSPVVRQGEAFVSGHEAVIDPELCTGCGVCARMCRFDAVRPDGHRFSVDAARCEGCRVCVTFCPEGAASFRPKTRGDWCVSDTRFGPMVHAQLHPGEENSGRLVTLLKTRARELARAQGRAVVLCDGSPGVGCPVISALSGADLAVVVTEPTPSGIHDLERALALCRHFGIRACVVLNTCDLNPGAARGIEGLCRARGCEIVARIPHDTTFFQAMLQRKAVTEMACANGLVSELSLAWQRMRVLAEMGRTNSLAVADACR